MSVKYISLSNVNSAGFDAIHNSEFRPWSSVKSNCITAVVYITHEANANSAKQRLNLQPHGGSASYATKSERNMDVLEILNSENC